MARTKQTERKTNEGLPKASVGGKGVKGVKGGKGGGGGGGGAGHGNGGGGSGGAGRRKRSKWTFQETIGKQTSSCSPKAEKTICACIPGDEEIAAYNEVMYIQISDGKVSVFKYKCSFTM